MLRGTVSMRASVVGRCVGERGDRIQVPHRTNHGMLSSQHYVTVAILAGAAQACVDPGKVEFVQAWRELHRSGGGILDHKWIKVDGGYHQALATAEDAVDFVPVQVALHTAAAVTARGGGGGGGGDGRGSGDGDDADGSADGVGGSAARVDERLGSDHDAASATVRKPVFPLVFVGVNGTQNNQLDSPSFFNRAEAFKVRAHAQPVVVGRPSVVFVRIHPLRVLRQLCVWGHGTTTWYHIERLTLALCISAGGCRCATLSVRSWPPGKSRA